MRQVKYCSKIFYFFKKIIDFRQLSFQMFLNIFYSIFFGTKQPFYPDNRIYVNLILFHLMKPCLIIWQHSTILSNLAATTRNKLQCTYNFSIPESNENYFSVK